MVVCWLILFCQRGEDNEHYSCKKEEDIMIRIFGKEITTQEAYWQALGEWIRGIAALSEAELKEELECHGGGDDTLLERILADITDLHAPYGIQEVFSFLEVFSDLFSESYYPEDGSTTMKQTFSHVYKELLHDHFMDDPTFTDLQIPFGGE
jgi:hypothetical protein